MHVAITSGAFSTCSCFYGECASPRVSPQLIVTEKGYLSFLLLFIPQVNFAVRTAVEDNVREKNTDEPNASGDPRPPELEEIRNEAKVQLENGQEKREDSDTEADEGTLPRGAGPRGHGPPMRTGKFDRERDLCDGAGICSLGRWPPWHRPPTRDHRILALRAALRRAVLDALGNSDGGLDGLFGRLAGGQLQSSPFSDTVKSDLAEYAMSLFDADGGGGARPREGDVPQPVRIRLLQAIQRAVDDPDPTAMDHFARGVRLGVGTRLPRTPAVYARKTRWRMVEQASADCNDEVSTEAVWRENYRSAKQCAEAVEKQLEEHHSRGLARKVAADRAELEYPGIRVSSLGAVAKLSEPGAEPNIRLVLDGSHGVATNTAIRVRDQDRCPTAADVKRQQRCQGSTRRGLGLAVDVAEAHRLPRVHVDDWRFQGCRARDGGDVYVYVVGVFGISSIAYWWSRLGGAAIRVLHTVADSAMELWLLLMADDIKVESTAEQPRLPLLFTLLFLEVLGIPLSWKKIHGGAMLQWIGYQVDVVGLQLGITASRAKWATDFCARLARDGRCRTDEFRSGLGRLSFIAGALEFERPFLAPLCAHASRLGDSRTNDLPMYIIIVLSYLSRRFQLRRMYPSAAIRDTAIEAFRVDACAIGDEIGIGGWLPTRDATGRLSTSCSPWFSVRLSSTNAPWAYHRGEPYRVIAALEALGVLLAVMAFGSHFSRNQDATVIIGGVTDNRGNAYVLNRLMSTKYPLCTVVMELAAQMEQHNLRVSVDWAPRAMNAEADDLSNSITTAFDPLYRVNLDLASLPWLVLPELMREGAEFDRNRPPLTQQRLRKKPKNARLREVDPW